MTERESSGSKYRVVEILLWTFSAAALGIVGWNLIDAKRYQLDAAEILAAPADPEEVAEQTRERGTVLAGTPLAQLEIPRLGISAVVAEGQDPSVLRRAIGHLTHSARPGEPGNIALAAHRDTFFRGLGDIREGDLIHLDSREKRDRYRVAWTEVVDPSEVEVTWPTQRPSLTLITCYPFRWIGPAPRRYVVRAHLETSGEETSVRSPPAPAGTPAREDGTLR